MPKHTRNTVSTNSSLSLATWQRMRVCTGPYGWLQQALPPEWRDPWRQRPRFPTWFHPDLPEKAPPGSSEPHTGPGRSGCQRPGGHAARPVHRGSKALAAQWPCWRPRQQNPETPQAPAPCRTILPQVRCTGSWRPPGCRLPAGWHSTCASYGSARVPDRSRRAGGQCLPRPSSRPDACRPPGQAPWAPASIPARISPAIDGMPARRSTVATRTAEPSMMIRSPRKSISCTGDDLRGK